MDESKTRWGRSARAQQIAIAACVAAAGLLGAGACKEKTELYCCSTPASCQRSGGGDGPVPCADPARPFCDDEGAYPASDGIKNTCIADPGEGPECEQAAECIDPMRPFCEGGRCVACAGAADCDATAPVCDEETGECVGCRQPSDCADHEGAQACAADGICVGCAGPDDCGAAAPVCDEDARTCRACAADAECGAGACDRLDGTCVAEAAVLYVEPGARGLQCTVNLPCGTLADAAAASREDRRLVRMAAGTYTGTTELSEVSLRVFADPGVILRPTPGEAVTIDVTGSSEVLLHGLEVSGATADVGARAVRCIDVGGNPILTLMQSSVKDAPGLGIEASNCTLEITQSEVSGNAGGGVSASGGRFNLVNNFLTQNGGGTALVGGANLSGTSDSLLEHNTVTGNLRSAGAVAGVLCTGSLVARNNIIFGNSNGAAEVSQECSHRFSLIGPEPEEGEGNLADPPTFVDASSGDFHLQSTSAGVDGADPSEVADDIDGDARPQGQGADMGADEVPAR